MDCIPFFARRHVFSLIYFSCACSEGSRRDVVLETALVASGFDTSKLRTRGEAQKISTSKLITAIVRIIGLAS